MRSLIILLALVAFGPKAYAEEIKRDSEIVTRNSSGVRNEYDDLMKSSGKWGFISTSFFTVGVVSGLTSLYCYQRGQTYRDLSNQRTLTPHEQSEKQKWQDYTDATGYGAAGLIGLGLGAAYMELKYEGRAHEFALDMKVNF